MFNRDGGGASAAGGVDLSSVSVTAVCPRCDRKESIDGELAAKAWLYEHIAVEHADGLPEYEGTE